MEEKKAAQAVQQMSKAQQGVERARKQAERGELISAAGRRRSQWRNQKSATEFERDVSDDC